MHRRKCLILLASVVAMSAAGCAQLKAVASDGSSEGVPKQARLVAESNKTVGIFEAELDGTLYIVNSDPAHKRPDVLAYSGPVMEGQILRLDTTASSELKEAMLDGKPLGLKLGDGDVLWRAFFLDRMAAANMGPR